MDYNSRAKQDLKNLFKTAPSGTTSVSLIRENKTTYKVNYSFINEELRKEAIAKTSVPTSASIDGEILETTNNVLNIRFFNDTHEICSSNCYSTYIDYLSPWNSGPVIPAGNREVVRPLKGGLYIFNGTASGTLGFIGIDRDYNCIVGVSNAHVVTSNPFFSYSQTQYGTSVNNSSKKIYQNIGSENEVGPLLRYYPIDASADDNIDAGLFYIPKEMVNETESFKQFGVTEWIEPMDFATTSELDNLWDVPLFKTGSRTGIMGENNRKIIFDGYYDASVAFGSFTPISASFEDTLSFKLQDTNINYGSSNNFCFNPTAPGDSGSCIVGEFNGVRKIVGLLFAGDCNYFNSFGQCASPYYGTIGLAIRIDKIQNYLNIDPYKGEPLSQFNDLYVNLPFYTYLTGDTVPYSVDLSGNTFYHMGKYTNT